MRLHLISLAAAVALASGCDLDPIDPIDPETGGGGGSAGGGGGATGPLMVTWIWAGGLPGTAAPPLISAHCTTRLASNGTVDVDTKDEQPNPALLVGRALTSDPVVATSTVGTGTTTGTVTTTVSGNSLTLRIQGTGTATTNANVSTSCGLTMNLPIAACSTATLTRDVVARLRVTGTEGQVGTSGTTVTVDSRARELKFTSIKMASALPVDKTSAAVGVSASNCLDLGVLFSLSASPANLETHALSSDLTFVLDLTSP